MMLLQEYLNSKYPTPAEKKKVTRIVDNWEKFYVADQWEINLFRMIAGENLDLEEYLNLEKIVIHGNYLGKPLISLRGLNHLLTNLTISDNPSFISINLSGAINLMNLEIVNSDLTFLSKDFFRQTLDKNHENHKLKNLSLTNDSINSSDFLEDLTNYKKLENLQICDNNIPPINVEIFSRLTSCLKELWIGTTSWGAKEEKKNIFFGSLDSFQKLLNLEILYINNTDVDGSLESLKYLTKLKSLEIGNTNINGSLQYLKNLNKLGILDISNTNINSGLEYLPASCETIYCANTPLEPYLKDFKKASGGCDYSAWRQANLSLIKQIQEIDYLLTVTDIIDSALACNNLTPELTQQEKVLQVLKFYLEEEKKSIQENFYQTSELVTESQASTR